MRKRVFTIAPGAPFLKTFAAALFEGRIVEGYSSELDPLAIAGATIYVPTRRASRALCDELSRALGRPALLPRILPLGALEETETALFFEEAGLDGAYEPGLPEAVGEITRRMLLTELIVRWARQLPHAIVSVGADGKYEFDARETFLVAKSAADAWHLSGELANLIDELTIEGIAWERLDPLALPELDRFWQITLDFLNIAIEQWPKILAERGLIDRARRQTALVEAQIRLLHEGPSGPVIAIGSTGANRATARLLAAIARAPQGAVVLPGLDLDLDGRAWSLIGGDRKRDIAASFTHPQAVLARLLESLQIAREDVVSLGQVARDLALRGKLISDALRPAESTDEWIRSRQSADPTELRAAVDGITLIEADDEREEALAIAIAMRQVLESPCETVALVTPDRKLARRVAAELARWGVSAEDSAGEYLSSRPLGTLARLAIGCAASKMEAADLAALLAHPLLRLGPPRAEAVRRAALLEIGVLRSSRGAGCLAELIMRDPSALIASARDEAAGRFAHPAKQRITEEQWASLEDLLCRLGTRLAPLMDLSGEHTLDQWAAAHCGVLEAIADLQDDADGQDWEALGNLFDELARSAPESMMLDIESYARLFASAAREIVLRETGGVNPRLQILGLLEARLIDADVMLLGGLDESVWPPQPKTDAFLNRPMRAALGLTPPERKLGQTAHDFAQAMGRRTVILSRARKREGVPTVASRFLQRMAALGGKAWEECRERGNLYLRLARAIDRPLVAASSERPLPKPPIALRPRQLSVTQIETLRRDPYAIYAEKILRLKLLDPIGGTLGPSEFGSAIHRALERFVSAYPVDGLPVDARDKLSTFLREELGRQLQDPDFAALEWPRIGKLIDFYLGFEAKRRKTIETIETEREGCLDIPLRDGSNFVLTARADRIEHHSGGRLTLVDYKTGAPPGVKEVKVGFSPQLTLEAAMALRGAFDPGIKIESIEALYLKLGGQNGGEERLLKFDGDSLTAVAERHLAGLTDLLDQFRDEAAGYPPRPFLKFARRYNAYDHLARVKEWSRSGEAEGNGA